MSQRDLDKVIEETEQCRKDVNMRGEPGGMKCDNNLSSSSASLMLKGWSRLPIRWRPMLAHLAGSQYYDEDCELVRVTCCSSPSDL
eukprot:6199380-Pleurochrysis_carterae.AAC.3